MAARRHADKFLLGIVGLLVFFGFIIFASASLGLLARDGAGFSIVTLKQVFLGIVLGGLALVGTSRLDYRVWKKYAFHLFIFSLVLTTLVFVPVIGLTHGGATRWIDLRIISFQPAEILKLGFVVYLAALLVAFGPKIKTWQYGLLPVGIALAASGLVLINQPDLGTLLVLSITGIAMFIGAGGKWKHVGVIIGVLGLMAAILLLIKPYALERVLTFVDPSRDPLGAGYQIKQSLIAVGSGEIFGRGFGRSIQKFQYLPEPTGDSIFAVAAEEFGFVGSVVLIVLFLLFAFRGFVLACAAPTRFGGLLILGLVILVVSQSFINIAAMLGVAPLTGMPLLFVSQGGTALFFTLLEMGIILNISKQRIT